MKRSIVTYSLGLLLLALTPGAFAQEQAGETNAGELGVNHNAQGQDPEPAQHNEGHGLTEGFHAPVAPFNLANPSPPPVREVHDGNVTEAKGPPPFIGPLINFAILVALGYMAVRRQVNPALAARRAAVETEIAEARRLHDEARAMHQEYAERLKNLESEAASLRADLVRQGEAERDRIVAEAHARAEKMRAEGTQMIEGEMRAAREELRREAALAAAAAAEEIVRKTITPADQGRIVDEFIQSLEGDARGRTTAGGASA